MSNRNEDLVPQEASASTHHQQQQQQQQQVSNINKPRKRDALFLGGTESSFSFGFGGDVSFGGGEIESTTIARDAKDDDDVNESDQDEGDDTDDEIERELALEQKATHHEQQQTSTSPQVVKVRVTLDQVIEARRRFTGVARGFFGMTNQQQQQPHQNNHSSENSITNENVSADAATSAVVAATFVPVHKRRTIHRDAHCRNVKNLFEKIRQETAEKVYERDLARKRKLESQQNKKGGAVEATFFEDDDDDTY